MKDARRQLLRKRAGRLLLAVIVLSAAAGVSWYRRLVREPVEDAVPVAPPSGTADMVTRDFRHVETRMDRTVWVLEAKRAEMVDQTARLTTVKITWYGDPGQLPVVVTSRTGRVNLRNRDAVLAGGVRVVRSDGVTMATERIAWDDDSKTLTAPLPLLISTPSLTLRGERMVANTERQWMKITGAVRADVVPGGRAAPGAEGGRDGDDG